MRRIAEQHIQPTRRNGHIVERYVHVVHMYEDRTISPDQYEDILEFVAGCKHMTIMQLKCCLGCEVYLHGLMGPAQDTIVVTLGKYLCEA